MNKTHPSVMEFGLHSFHNKKLLILIELIISFKPFLILLKQDLLLFKHVQNLLCLNITFLHVDFNLYLYY